MAVLAIVDNNKERINEFSSISSNVDYDGKIQFFDSGEALLTYIEKNLQNSEELPDLIFFNITLPVKNGRSFVVEYNTLPQSFRTKCQVVVYSSEVNDRFFMPNDLNRSEINLNGSFSELFDGLVLSNNVKCFS